MNLNKLWVAYNEFGDLVAAALSKYELQEAVRYAGYAMSEVYWGVVTS